MSSVKPTDKKDETKYAKELEACVVSNSKILFGSIIQFLN
jgi:hypothetical protein